ncbi:unnamed protein product [Allacma fusca]|uniref:Uncharacterized protein n=1 Tax=Allacma fusca TaxID=39272 RepID=A0A8J2KGP2_9HEXA|nr:unnamed protein product [Allacma fusca]
MANMAGFDILIGFTSLRVKASLKELEHAGAVPQNNAFRQYKMLEILVKLMNETFSIPIFANFGLVFMMLPFFIYGLKNYAISALTSMFFLWCCLFQVVRVALIWIPMALVHKESNMTLSNLKSIISFKSANKPWLGLYQR